MPTELPPPLELLHLRLLERLNRSLLVAVPCDSNALAQLPQTLVESQAFGAGVTCQLQILAQIWGELPAKPRHLLHQSISWEGKTVGMLELALEVAPSPEQPPLLLAVTQIITHFLYQQRQEELLAYFRQKFDSGYRRAAEEFKGRQMAEEVLQEQARLSEQYLDVAGVIIVVLSAEQKITLVNRMGAQILGRSPSELLGKNWFETCLPPDRIDEVKEVFARIMAGQAEQAEYFTNEILTGKGERRLISWHNVLLRYANGAPKGLLASGNDITEQAKSQKEVEESELRYRSLVQTSDNAICSIDAQGRVVNWNPAASTIFGFSEAEMLGNTLECIIPLDLRKGHTQALQRLINGRAPSRLGQLIELRGRRKSGEEFPLELTLAQWETRSGKYYSGIMRDISRRKAAEEELTRSRERFQRIVQEAPFPMMVVAEDGEILQTNQVWYELTGYTPAELTRLQDWFHHAYGADAAETGRYLARLRDMQGRVAEGTKQVVSHTGETRFWEFSSSPGDPLPDGRKVLITMAMDVTERLLAENQLRFSERRLHEAQLLAGLGNWNWNVREDEFTFSPGIYPIIGMEQQGRRFGLSEFLNLITPKDRAKIQHLLERVWATDQGFHVELQLDLATGPKVVEFRAEALADKEDPLHIFGVMLDISRQKEAERILVQARQVAEEASRAKSAFLANTSHEIRTPIHGIMGLTDLLLQGTQDEEQQKYLQVIQRSSEHLLEIVNQVLDYSKLAAGEMKLTEVGFDLSALVTDLVDLYRSQALAKGVELHSEIDPRIPPGVVGDQVKLRQVLHNLLSNAVKYTHAGMIKLSVRLLQETPQGLMLYISVKDTGIGISEEQTKKLFTPFSQGDISYSRKYGGTGLGLAICKSLLELAGTELQMDSQLGRGTTFWFKLLLKPGAALPLHPPLSYAKGAGPLHLAKSLKLLLVEDDPVNQVVARETLERLGFVVDLAETGVQAVQMFAEGVHDLILMDVQMPEMDGIEATRRIRALETEQGATRIPIVALTAHALEEDSQRCLDAGMDDYLSKPILLPYLLKALAPLLPPGSVTSLEQGTAKPVPKALPPALVEVLLRSLPKKLDGLEAALQAQDANQGARWAHDLKSNFAAVQRLDLKEQYAAIEARLKQNQLAGTLELTLKTAVSAREFLQVLAKGNK